MIKNGYKWKKVVSLAATAAEDEVRNLGADARGPSSDSRRPKRALRLPSYLRTHQLISLKKTTRAKRLAKKKITNDIVPTLTDAANGTTENVAKNCYYLSLPAFPEAASLHNAGHATEMPISLSENIHGPNVPYLASPKQASTSDSSDAETSLHCAMDGDKNLGARSPEPNKMHDCLLMLAHVAHVEDDWTSESSPLTFSCIYTRKHAGKSPVAQPPESDDNLEQSCGLSNRREPMLSDSNSPKERTTLLSSLVEVDEGIVTNRLEKSNQHGISGNVTAMEMNKSDEGASILDKADGSSITTVAGCELEEKYVHAAECIIAKHGDILANTIFAGGFRSLLLRSACAINMKLERLNFAVLTLDEVESMRRDVQDLERAQVEVGWLANRLDDLHAAKELEHRCPLLDLELQLRHSQRNVRGLARRLTFQKNQFLGIKAQLEAEKKKIDATYRNILEAREKVMPFLGKSLLDGI